MLTEFHDSIIYIFVANDDKKFLAWWMRFFSNTFFFYIKQVVQN